MHGPSIFHKLFTVRDQRAATEEAKLQARARLIMAVKDARNAGIPAVQIAEILNMPESSVRHILKSKED